MLLPREKHPRDRDAGERKHDEGIAPLAFSKGDNWRPCLEIDQESGTVSQTWLSCVLMWNMRNYQRLLKKLRKFPRPS